MSTRWGSGGGMVGGKGQAVGGGRVRKGEGGACLLSHVKWCGQDTSHHSYALSAS
jgi:hypothetical protein